MGLGLGIRVRVEEGQLSFHAVAEEAKRAHKKDPKHTCARSNQHTVQLVENSCSIERLKCVTVVYVTVKYVTATISEGTGMRRSIVGKSGQVP